MLPPERILRYSVIATSAALALLLLPDEPVALLAVLTLIPVSNGLTFPNYTALISNLSGRDSQGEILGITQSIQALGMAIPPIIAGYIASADVGLPVLAASCITFIAWALFAAFFRKGKEKFHEL
jgi:MFS family permease